MVLIRNFRVINDKHGYLVQRSVGRQWKDTRYCSDLGDAGAYLFDRLLESETNELNVDLGDLDNARLLLIELSDVIERIKTEILEALHGQRF